MTAVNAASHQPVGRAIAQDPQNGVGVPFGSAVTVQVSSGPNPTQRYLDIATGGDWSSSRSSVINWNGTMPSPYGSVGSVTATLEDGNSYSCLQMLPPADGVIRGILTLRYPILPGDHFRTTLGFQSPHHGAGRFQMDITVPDPTATGGQVTYGMFGSAENGSDGAVTPVDIDLTPYAGGTQVWIEFLGGLDPTDDWACWADPRIE
jgi:hypothetical protein